MVSYYSKFIQNFLDKLMPLNHNKEFPLPPLVLHYYHILKNNLKDSTLVTVDTDKEFEVETDANHYCITATLN